MLREDALRQAEGGLALSVRLPWYRSLPLSCVEEIELALDGERVPRDGLRLVVGGRVRRLEDLAALHDEEWFVRDPASILVSRSVETGQAVDVRVALRCRVPYISPAPGTPLRQVTERAMRLVVHPSEPVPSLQAPDSLDGAAGAAE
ncbi:MAG: DUF6379 domain-containing protein [Thermoleophilia bacterium]|nr:DUF6379 domain-containing protein [Thermoleophilia bacterium]